MSIGTDQHVTRCWALANHGFQCHQRSTHLVTVINMDMVPVASCVQHLGKVIDHVCLISGQRADAPMTVTIVTVPSKRKGR